MYSKPIEHVIIEGHFGCLGWMRREGWYNRPGVRVLEGQWQDFFPPQTPESDNTKPFNTGKFDIVYFDTFPRGLLQTFFFYKTCPKVASGPELAILLFQ